MNFDIYLISGSPGKWIQYPDYSEEPFFDAGYYSVGDNPDIVIMRRGNMMYYTFMRPVGGGELFGITIAVNSAMVTDLSILASTFSQAWERLIESGTIISFDSQQELQVIPGWTKEQFIIESFRKWLVRVLAAHSNSFRPLDSLSTESEIGGIREIDYSVSPWFTKVLLDAAREQATAMIHLDNSFDTASYTAFQKAIGQLKEKNLSLERQITDLTKKHIALKKKQKQYDLVFMLGAVCVVAVIFVFIMNRKATEKANALDSTQKELGVTTNTLVTTRDSLNISNARIDSLTEVCKSLEKQNGILTSEKQALQRDKQRLERLLFQYVDTIYVEY